ncbi:MAG: hypothetical protein U5K84_03460 [Alkalibacterium sp.]|nr:hypothetical protein [Alkalibacterium sp.]
MSFILVWVIQLVAFFAIVTSVASALSRYSKSASKPAGRTDHSEMDAPKQQVDKLKRNEQRPARKNNRPVREDKYTRTPRARDRVRETHKPMIKEVSTLKDPYRTKEKKVSTTFSRKRLKQAIVYKEILDKPMSMRDE